MSLSVSYRYLLPDKPVVRSDLHKAFDSHLGTNGTTNAGWALVPEESLVEEIALKIENEQDRRKNEGINGPWPDFRSEGVSGVSGVSGVWSFSANENTPQSTFIVVSSPERWLQIYICAFDPKR